MDEFTLFAGREVRASGWVAFGWLPDQYIDRDVMLRQVHAFNRGSRLIIALLAIFCSNAIQPQTLCDCREEDAAGGEGGYSGRSAKVQTEPPGDTLSLSCSRAAFHQSPPIPDSIVTYCRP